MIKEKIDGFIKRKNPELKTKTSYNTISRRKTVDYKYFICDSCGCEINMSIPKDRRNGGPMTLGYLLTKKESCVIACCNSCVSKVLKEFA